MKRKRKQNQSYKSDNRTDPSERKKNPPARERERGGGGAGGKEGERGG